MVRVAYRLQKLVKKKAAKSSRKSPFVSVMSSKMTWQSPGWLAKANQGCWLSIYIVAEFDVFTSLSPPFFADVQSPFSWCFLQFWEPSLHSCGLWSDWMKSTTLIHNLHLGWPTPLKKMLVNWDYQIFPIYSESTGKLFHILFPIYSESHIKFQSVPVTKTTRHVLKTMEISCSAGHLLRFRVDGHGHGAEGQVEAPQVHLGSIALGHRGRWIWRWHASLKKR